MDLGIHGRTALVCAASKGLGKGCAMSLAREGVNLVITARGKDALERTAEELRATFGVTVVTVAGDIATEEGRRAALVACPAPDILVNNAGGPPPGDFREWDREAWVRALDASSDRAAPRQGHHQGRVQPPVPGRLRWASRRRQRPSR